MVANISSHFADIERTSLNYAIKWNTGAEIAFLRQQLQAVDVAKLTNDEKGGLIALQLRVTVFNQMTQQYKLTFWNLVWSIITFSFTYFKVKRAKNQLQSLSQELQKMTNLNGISAEQARWVPKKIKVLEAALVQITADSALDTSVLGVKQIFEEKLAKLKRGEHTPIGSWYHATRKLGQTSADGTGNGAIGIIASGAVLPGPNAVWGEGVYTSSIPEIGGYGQYVFALDESALDPNPGKFVIQSRLSDRIWTVFKKAVLINRDSTMLYVPDQEARLAKLFIDSLATSFDGTDAAKQLKQVEVYSASEAQLMMHYYDAAEEALKLVHIPAKLTLHFFASRTITPPRYKDALKEARSRW